MKTQRIKEWIAAQIKKNGSKTEEAPKDKSLSAIRGSSAAPKIALKIKKDKEKTDRS